MKFAADRRYAPEWQDAEKALIAKKDGPAGRSHPSCRVSRITCPWDDDDDVNDDDGEDDTLVHLKPKKRWRRWQPKREQSFA
jgi:hypothetical protein